MLSSMLMPADAEPGDVVGHPLGLVGVAVLDVHADVARAGSPAPGQREVRVRVARPPSGRPMLEATPKLVVPIAANPASTNASADGTSQALGSSSGLSW